MKTYIDGIVLRFSHPWRVGKSNNALFCLLKRYSAHVSHMPKIAFRNNFVRLMILFHRHTAIPILLVRCTFGVYIFNPCFIFNTFDKSGGPG